LTNLEGYDYENNLFLEDCEENKFWMVNHFQKSISNFQTDIDGDISAGNNTKAKQNERLWRAKLLSGYYSLKLQSIENGTEDNATETETQFQSKRKNSQGMKIGFSNTEEKWSSQSMGQSHLTTLRAEALLQKYHTSCKRQKTSSQLSVYSKIQNQVISSLSLGEFS
jgi:hypothetical protein